ncbi:capsular polysaccharide transport system permease protein [Rhodobacter sp. 140A]|nr:capsular polysaccharide transport system permease protein [Rhodobacter sp. 140A]
MPSTDISPPNVPSRVQTRHFATLRTIIALMLREMSTRYGRSPGGYLWAILEPLGGTLVLAAGFSLLVRSPALGNSFILFYATGMMPFTLYNSVANSIASSLNFSRPLLRYPSVIWLDAALARFILNTLTNLMVISLLFTGILIIAKTGSVLSFGPILTALALAAFLGLGVGLMNCLLSGLYPAWSMIWSIITRPLFLASGVLMLMERLPHAVQQVLWYNPLFHVIGLMRRGFYPMYKATYVSTAYVVAVGLALCALGLVLLMRYHKDILST